MSKRYISWIVILLMAAFSNWTIVAQPYYTQLDNIEPFISPSLNGLSANKDLRVSLSYRSNNLNIGSPFHTAYLSVDGRALARYLNNKAWIGWGIGGLYDIAGAGNLTTTSLYLNLAYHQLVSPTIIISGGIGIGWDNKTINQIGGLTFPIQWQGAFFDQTISNQESNLAESVSSLDVRAGLNLTFLFSADFLLTFGGSMRYINEPVETFYTSSLNVAKIPPRYSGILQTYHNIKDILYVKNSMLYSSQNNYTSFTLGSSWEWLFNPYNETMSILLGVYYRYSNVIVPSIGFRLDRFTFLFSYDIFINDLSTTDYFYRIATESNINYYTQFPNTTFEQLITVCPDHF